MALAIPADMAPIRIAVGVLAALSISSWRGLSGSGAPLMLLASSTNLMKNSSRTTSWTR